MFARPELARRLSHRRFGVGCDQVLLLYPSTVADFRDQLLSDRDGDGSVRTTQSTSPDTVLELVRDNVLWIILAGASVIVGFLATVLK